MMIATLHHKPCRPPLAAGLASRCAALCFIVFFLVATTFATETHAQIQEYGNDVFTNEGQSSVKDFGVKLSKAAAALKLVNPLKVYVGYHGKTDGTWCRDFSGSEISDVLNMKLMFPHSTLVPVFKPGMSDQDIKDAVKAGNVFFTWCDSNTRVKAVVGGAMPGFVREFK